MNHLAREPIDKCGLAIRDVALRDCLPAETFDLVRRTSGANDDVLGSHTHQLREVMTQHFPGLTDELITCVDCNAFRRALFAGLGDAVRFGRTLASYRVTETGRVRVEFAEGGTDEGDLLVGADGVSSAVRRQLLPHAGVQDLGIRCVYGRMTLAETTEALLPGVIRRGVNWVADETGCGAGFAPVRFRARSDSAANYMMITLLTTPERIGVPDEELSIHTSQRLSEIATTKAADTWHPQPSELFTRADPETFFPIKMRAGERVEAWQSGPVTPARRRHPQHAAVRWRRREHRVAGLRDAGQGTAVLRARRQVGHRRGRRVRARHAPARLRYHRQLTAAGRPDVRRQLV